MTVDEGLGSLAAIRALGRAGHRPVVGAWRADTYAARSRAADAVVSLPDPADDPDGHVRALAEAAAKLDVAAVLPGTEPSQRALTLCPAAFPASVAVGRTAAATLERATDKRLLNRLAAEAGFDVLPLVVLGAGEPVPDGLSYPAIVKPVRSVVPAAGGRLRVVKVARVSDAAELGRVRAQSPGASLLAQPYVHGRLAAICGVAWEGRVVCAVHQESPRTWPAGTGISSYARTVPAHPARAEAARALVAAIGWSGIFGLQYLCVADRAYAIDFNPRIYGSLALAVAAGHNLPAIWAALVLGEPPVVGRYRPGTGYRVWSDDLRALGREWRAGRRVAALGGLLPRRRTVHGAYVLSDPLPLLAGLPKLRRALTRRGER